MDPGVWWPAETDFEIGVGAILTQNTSWTNVEYAIAALRQHKALTPDGLLALEDAHLTRLIRPAGFMNAKTTYLRHYTVWYQRHYDSAAQLPTDQLRDHLLTVRGIGPETADVLALYVYQRPVFIWDTYARRLLATAGYVTPPGYEAARRALTDTMLEAGFTAVEQQRFHGLIVEAGKAATAAGGWDTYWHHLGF